jgi:hypothetical protein
MTVQFQKLVIIILGTTIILTNCTASKTSEDLISTDTEMKEKEKNKTKKMYREINAWIDIDATPDEAWEVLVDFKSWESWNSFIPLVEGNLKVGERMRIMVVPPDSKPMKFKPIVYEVIPQEKILWGGSFLKIIYRGDHAFLLESLQNGKTRFRQIERFRGPIVLFMGNMIKKTEIGYHQMNQAFKEQVEEKNRN